MSLKEKPHYTLRAATLAKWIEEQPDKWWSVDGDPLLTSILDFPCPSDELAPAIRKIDKDLVVQDNRPGSQAKGEYVQDDLLNKLSDTHNKRHQRTFRLSWSNSDLDWLLIEDEAMAPV